MTKILGSPKSTKSVYVGVERYEAIEALARRISHITNFTVKPSAVIHHIVDNNLQAIEEQMIARITAVKEGK